MVYDCVQHVFGASWVITKRDHWPSFTVTFFGKPTSSLVQFEQDCALLFNKGGLGVCLSTAFSEH